ncbi:hypothetical protein GINT2_002089 [Glugoides intestinalis]
MESVKEKAHAEKLEKAERIKQLLKKRFFVTPTGYPPLNGFLDYGPALTQIKRQVIEEYRRFFVDEDVYEIEPSVVLPYEVLKNSGHVDKFCDVILSDGANIVRADHFIEEKIGEIINIPVNLIEDFGSVMEQTAILKTKIITDKKRKANEITQFTEEEVNSILSNFICAPKHIADFTKQEINFVVNLYNLYSSSGKAFESAKDFKLIFNLNDRLFLRPELAQSIFTNFRKLFEMNGEKLPFSTLCIGKSFRNEISARGGMLRTKEFEQAEIEYFTEDGNHSGFKSIKSTSVLIYPNTCDGPYQTTIEEAYTSKTIPSEAVCYFIAKAQEFCLSIGITLDSLRFRQHKENEMAHYADDCWDVEVKTLSGWVECAGIADRSNFDLRVHSKDLNVQVKREITPKMVYTIIPNKGDAGKKLKSKFKDFEALLAELTQEYIVNNMKDNFLEILFDGEKYPCTVESKKVDCEFFIPRVIEPSFGISRIVYCLVEQSFLVRDERNVLSLKPKMCYLHSVIGFLKYYSEFDDMVNKLKDDMKGRSLRFKITERSCSIGRKYSSFDELGVPFFVTFDESTKQDNQVTIRERDTMTQIRVKVDAVAKTIERLIKEEVTWNELYASTAVMN